MLHKLSLLMTGLVMMMGAAWFGLHTYGAPDEQEPRTEDVEAVEESSAPTTEREAPRDTGAEETKAALMIARATLNSQLAADAAPLVAVAAETMASASKPAQKGQPIVLAPALPKAEPSKVAAKPVAEKPAAKPQAPKPDAAKPDKSKSAAKPKSIDDILDSLE